MMTTESIQQLSLVLGAIVAGIAVFEGIRRVIVVPTVRFGRVILEFLSDWKGEPERPGHDERPGVMAQLAALRDEQSDLKDQVENLAAEFRDFKAEITAREGRKR